MEQSALGVTPEVRAVLTRHGWFPRARLSSAVPATLDGELSLLASGGAPPHGREYGVSEPEGGTGAPDAE